MGCVHSSFAYRWPSAVVPVDLSGAPHLNTVIRDAFAAIEKVTPFRFVDIGTRAAAGFLAFTETQTDDPLPGSPLVSGNWKSIRGDHRLTQVAPGLVVDWVPDAAPVRVWQVDFRRRKPSTSAPLDFLRDDPFVDPAAFDDKWPSGVAGNQLVPLGNDRVLTIGSTGHYRVWQFRRAGKSVSIDPNVVAHGQLEAPVFVKGTKLIGVDFGFVLSFLPDDGSHQLFQYEFAARGTAPVLTALTNKRRWKSIGVGHELVSLGGSRVLDIQLSGQYRIFPFHSAAVADDDPLEGPPVAKGAWPTTVLNEMVSLDNDHVLAYRPADGEYRVWIYQRNASHSDSIGRAGFRQEIFLQLGSGIGTALHEIGHALGFFHEVQRPDRDLHVVVARGNIASGEEGNFERLSDDEVDTPTPYDFSSIMHYREHDFSKNGEPTLIAPTGVVLGGAALTNFDVRTANYIADPFPGDPRAHGNFKLIRSATELVPMSKDRVLHRVPGGLTFRVLSMNPNVTGHASPFGDDPLTQGVWSSITAAHRLIRLDDELMLDWAPSNGSFRVWKMELHAKGSEDPLSAETVTHGHWSSIREGHELVVLGRHRILDWVPGDGTYRVWKHDPNAKGSEDPFPELVRSGKWASIGSTHALIALGDGNVLDWDPFTGHYRIFAVNADSEGGNEVFHHTPLAKGVWNSIRVGHVLISLSEHRILDWEPKTGDFRLWNYHANFA